jgi:3-hydroxybutyryl-CoA dehydratase
MAIAVGDSFSRTTQITDERIRQFAAASGDTNSVHLDNDYAKTTRFGKRIAHGMLTASLISSILGNDFPGVGTIYLSQSAKFKAPVFIDDEITATVEVTAYREDKRITTLKTTCTNQDGTVVVEGEAVVIAPEPSENA